MEGATAAATALQSDDLAAVCEIAEFASRDSTPTVSLPRDHRRGGNLSGTPVVIDHDRRRSRRLG